MPTLYLSPSTQEYNLYEGGGNEEEYMNLVADAMEPYLNASGIQFMRNNPGERVGAAIRQSNAGNYDLHLALHSNAAPESLAGALQGTDVYYSRGSANGQRAADIIAANFKEIYPQPDLVKAVPTSTLTEVMQTRAPAVLIETAYHDNPEDAEWIRTHVPEIARNLAQSVAEYFGIPFVEPQEPRNGTVVTEGGNLNIRTRPDAASAPAGVIPNGATVQVRGRTGDWYIVYYRGIVGYAYAPYIQLE